ncbi:MAG: hypothetical protein LBR53_02700 [Deltaproteobacteria bacterium]|jgi:hypothetical protein|nr:hypothetical protein [Deltaproteobacteria bacterium]
MTLFPRLPVCLLLLSVLTLAGCGVVTDFVKDHELSVPFLGPEFISPVKLRIGVIPFEDQALLGNSEAGPNMARLVAETYQENSNFLVVDTEEVRRYVESRGIKYPMTPEEASEIGRALNLNVVFEGAISHVGEHQQRTGWRKLVRWFTSKSQFVDGILLIRAYDPSDGSVITSRSSESNVRVGAAEAPGMDGAVDVFKPNQEEIEETLDEALDMIYYRSLDGLRALPFKAVVTNTEGDDLVTINFGDNVGMKRGLKFVLLSYPETITSDIGYVYNIPGAPIARLRVESVSERSSVLKVEEGMVGPGDVIQTWTRD